MKKNIFMFVLLMVVMPFASAAAKQEIFMKKSWDYAINGYDTVAYFTEGKPVEGTDEFVTEYKDVKWRFSSAENLEKFKKDPDAYRPQYGGHCGYALGKNAVLVKSNPEAFLIADGKLYLNLSGRIQKKFKKEHEFYIKNGDSIWPRILTEDVEADW